MPNWNGILDELKNEDNQHDRVRRKYLKQLQNKTKRNVIAYYSGYLQSRDPQGNYDINEADKIGFMTTIHGLDPDKGLDLILHTPGGSAAATEALIHYIKSIFGNDVRAIVPQIAMSGGTIMALSCKSILMGKQSSLGPIDPQIHGIPAHGIVEEYNKAIEEIKEKPMSQIIWSQVFSKYHPTLIQDAGQAWEWAKEMTTEFLKENMFADREDSEGLATQIVDELNSHVATKAHDRRITLDYIGRRLKDLVIERLEEDNTLQDKVLSVHHSYMLTFSQLQYVQKIIENHNGTAYIFRKEYKVLMPNSPV